MFDVNGGPGRRDGDWDAWVFHLRERLDRELGMFLDVDAGVHAITGQGDLGERTPRNPEASEPS